MVDPYTPPINLGQSNVALANASAINRAAQLVALSGEPFPMEAQDAGGILSELSRLGYASELDRQKMERSAGRLHPVRAFSNWQDVEFAVTTLCKSDIHAD